MLVRWKAAYLRCLWLSSDLPQKFQDNPIKLAMAVSVIILSSSYTIIKFDARVSSQLKVRLSLYLQSITFKSSFTFFVMRSSELINYALRKVTLRILLASSSKYCTFFFVKFIKVKNRKWCDWNFFLKESSPLQITRQHVKLY